MGGLGPLSGKEETQPMTQILLQPKFLLAGWWTLWVSLAILVRWPCGLHGLYKCFLFTFWADIVGPDSTDFDLVFLCGPFA